MASTLDIYNQIHEDMKKKYQNQQQIMLAKENAAILQDFFIAMKRTGMNRPKNLSVIDELGFNETYKRLEDAMSIVNKQINFKKMFLNSSWSSFESQIARIHQAAEQSLTQNFSNFKDIKIGSVGANPGTSDTINIEKVFIDAIEKTENKTLEELVGKQFMKGIIQKGRSGKIDVKGNKNIQIQYESGIPDRILTLLANSNFTLKNYGSTFYDRNSKQIILQEEAFLKLGSTFSTKALTSIISSVTGYDVKTSLAIAIRGLISGLEHNNAEVVYHLNHLKIAYELSGAGLVYQNYGAIGENDYLIYNDPDSADIQVRSVAALIAEALEENNKDYSSIVGFKRQSSRRNMLTREAKKKLSRYGN